MDEEIKIVAVESTGPIEKKPGPIKGFRVPVVYKLADGREIPGAVGATLKREVPEAVIRLDARAKGGQVYANLWDGRMVSYEVRYGFY